MIYYDYSTIQYVYTAVVPGTRYECRRRTMITDDYLRFTHVSLTSVPWCATISHS